MICEGLAVHFCIDLLAAVQDQSHYQSWTSVGPVTRGVCRSSDLLADTGGSNCRHQLPQYEPRGIRRGMMSASV